MRSRSPPAGHTWPVSRSTRAATERRVALRHSGHNGDPQLHTRVTVANRVQGPDGRRRILDSAILHKAAVAYSETYNLLLADEITRRTGLTWDHRERQEQPPRRPRTHRSTRRVDRRPLPMIRRHRSRRRHHDHPGGAPGRAATQHERDQPDPPAPDPDQPRHQERTQSRRIRPAKGSDRRSRSRS
ncbi:relaxase domain-containing protein [Nakamurella sp.]|uniref:relaxase domain-containing protein n=1 Tax=Nakamurella sp. TaxID=1869182 RepID=UPI003B3A7637